MEPSLALPLVVVSAALLVLLLVARLTKALAGLVRAAVLAIGALVGLAACVWLVGAALTIARTPAWEGWQAPLSTAAPTSDPSAAAVADPVESTPPARTPSTGETPPDGRGTSTVPLGDSSSDRTTLPGGATAGGVLGQEGELAGQPDEQQLRLLLGEATGSAVRGDLPAATAASLDTAPGPAPTPVVPSSPLPDPS